MVQINKSFILKSFENAVNYYSDATQRIGLWQSEKYVAEKYFTKKGRILDIGCGTGRTTIGLYELGFNNVLGLDLSPHMVNEALIISENKGYNLNFVQGDATKLTFENDLFDYAIFSFNGIMQIPLKENRINAFIEINRVLKDKGIFIFTTFDRDSEECFKEFWSKEKLRWKNGNHDKRIFEFGDRIITSDDGKRDLYIHIPNKNEINECLKQTNFTVIEQFYRKDLFNESNAVKNFSGECVFWVVQKQ
ncbi:class I SAM-dependent methyltransferase [Bacillus sp. SM2101]|uniref:class I SAM-dependent methyltransferase n=1 Tax=Bacillus sp. SM2101 TaxID=2805366 RepID=UPI001BDEF8A0